MVSKVETTGQVWDQSHDVFFNKAKVSFFLLPEAP